MTLEQSVLREVEELHEFFVGWFSGSTKNDDAAFERGFDRRFAPSFVLVPPAGSLMTLAGLRGAIRGGHGSNPEFRIAIRNVSIRQAEGPLVVATYEEWQRNAESSQPPDNGRIATVVFRRAAERPALQWLHVHETWLPDDVMAGGPYDF